MATISETQKNELNQELLSAVLSGDEKQVSLLLEKGADPDTRNETGDTLLNLSLSSETVNPAIVELLVEGGAHINFVSADRVTALMCAVYNVNVSYETVAYLLQAGASVYSRDTYGQTPLLYATGREDVSLVELLLLHGASVNETDADGNSLMFEAVRQGYQDLFSFLLEEGADLTIRDYQGTTLLMAAIEQKQLEMADLLLKFPETDALAERVDGLTAYDMISVFLSENEELSDEEKKPYQSLMAALSGKISESLSSYENSDSDFVLSNYSAVSDEFDEAAETDDFSILNDPISDEADEYVVPASVDEEWSGEQADDISLSAEAEWNEEESADISLGADEEWDAEEPAADVSLGATDEWNEEESADISLGADEEWDEEEPADISLGATDEWNEEEPADISLGATDEWDAEEPADISLGADEEWNEEESADISLGATDEWNEEESADISLGADEEWNDEESADISLGADEEWNDEEPADISLGADEEWNEEESADISLGATDEWNDEESADISLGADEEWNEEESADISLGATDEWDEEDSSDEEWDENVNWNETDEWDESLRDDVDSFDDDSDVSYVEVDEEEPLADTEPLYADTQAIQNKAFNLPLYTKEAYEHALKMIQRYTEYQSEDGQKGVYLSGVYLSGKACSQARVHIERNLLQLGYSTEQAHEQSVVMLYKLIRANGLYHPKEWVYLESGEKVLAFKVWGCDHRTLLRSLTSEFEPEGDWYHSLNEIEKYVGENGEGKLSSAT